MPEVANPDKSVGNRGIISLILLLILFTFVGEEKEKEKQTRYPANKKEEKGASSLRRRIGRGEERGNRKVKSREAGKYYNNTTSFICMTITKYYSIAKATYIQLFII